MAHSATGVVQKAVDTRTPPARSIRALDETSNGTRAIPLRLDALVSPYKGIARLSFRIERLPPLARLSRGHNNGNGSWLLSLEELNALEYLLPQGTDAHTLAVRIMDPDAGAETTLAVLEFSVSPSPTGSVTEEDTPAEGAPAAPQSERAGLALHHPAVKTGGPAAGKAERDESRFASLTGGHITRRVSGLAQPAMESASAEMEDCKSGEITGGLLARKGEARPSVFAFKELAARSFPDADELQRLRAELAQARFDAERARESGMLGTQTLIRKAAHAWTASESTHFTSAEVQRSEQSAKALAEARAAYEAAETSLARLRTELSRAPGAAGDVGARPAIEDPALSPSPRKLADQEAEPSQSRSLPKKGGLHSAHESKLDLRGNRIIDVEEILGSLRPAPRDRRRVGHVLAAAPLALFAIASYFGAPLVPESWRPNIAMITSIFEPAIGRSDPVLKAAPATPQKAVAPQMAVIARSVNLRANPATWGQIISTLPQGLRVAMIEKRGNWSLIKADGANGEGRPLVGWTFNAFLKVEGGRYAKPPATEQIGHPR
jgi:hypothetical protein